SVSMRSSSTAPARPRASARTESLAPATNWTRTSLGTNEAGTSRASRVSRQSLRRWVDERGRANNLAKRRSMEFDSSVEGENHRTATRQGRLSGERRRSGKVRKRDDTGCAGVLPFTFRSKGKYRLLDAEPATLSRH